jgi:UDP-3-O-[3-hydroxymyristoyl] glucosamine N-acyltransferase
MYRLSEVAPADGALGEVLRDAAFARTDYATAETGPVLACAAKRTYLDLALRGGAVTALVVPPELAAEVPEPIGVLVDPDPEIAFYRLHNLLARDHGMRVQVENFVDPTASIHPEAWVEPGCHIGPGVTIEARAVVQTGTILDEGVTVGVGAMVGIAGRYVKRRPGLLLRVEQVGGVHVGREAEIEAGAMVQREVHPGFTRIGERSVIGVGASVSHGTVVGDDATLAVGAMVCGYVTIGPGAWIGPGAVVTNSIEIGAGARLEIGAVAVRDVPAGERWSGLFAGPHRAMLRLGAGATTGRVTRRETPSE